MNHKSTRQKLGYEKLEIHSRLNYFQSSQTKSIRTFADEISESLTQDLKSINPKFFYDDKGSELFEKITKLPEYYLTRAETTILKQLDGDFLKHLPKKIRLVELGSGSSEKTRIVLDLLSKHQPNVEYFPIDISDILRESTQDLHQDYDNLHITGIIDTYEGGLELIKNYDDCPNLIAFLGSSFGNFTFEEGKSFLQKINSEMKNDDLFFIGLDLVKDSKIIERAYDDSHGVTAEFNLNVLSRINKELDANFNLSKFEHHAVYDEKNQRIDMYLRSLANQSIKISKVDLSLQIQKDELIHTEHSHKYSIDQIKSMMTSNGFKINHIWKDDKNHYALVLASKF